MKPFRVAQPPSVNCNETRAVSAPPGGKAIVRSRASGDPLPNASQDYPDHNPEIRWPQPAVGVDHMPFKTNK